MRCAAMRFRSPHQQLGGGLDRAPPNRDREREGNGLDNGVSRSGEDENFLRRARSQHGQNRRRYGREEECRGVPNSTADLVDIEGTK